MTTICQQTQKIFFALGTVNTLTVWDSVDETVLNRAKQCVLSLHNRLSAFDNHSEIGQINACAGKKPVTVSPDTLHLIEQSVRYAEQTEGLFDITIRPLSALWKASIRQKRLPDSKTIATQAALTDYRDILIDHANHTVMLRQEGQSIDLGAIAKGYAADAVRHILLEEGIQEAVINLGGTVVTLGKTRRIGLQHPLAPTGTPFGYLRLQQKAVVTSGLYEQGFFLNGYCYHHIIHPHTGYPTDSELLGVTLIGEQAEQLDALSTCAFMLGVERSLDLLQPYSIEAVFVTKDGQIYTTEALRHQLILIGKEVQP